MTRPSVAWVDWIPDPYVEEAVAATRRRAIDEARCGVIIFGAGGYYAETGEGIVSAAVLANTQAAGAVLPVDVLGCPLIRPGRAVNLRLAECRIVADIDGLPDEVWERMLPYPVAELSTSGPLRITRVRLFVGRGWGDWGASADAPR